MLPGFWSRPSLDAGLNRDIIEAIILTYTSDPVKNLRNNFKNLITLADTVTFISSSPLNPPCFVVRWTGSVWVIFGGTSGTTHIDVLTNGWIFPNQGPYQELGISPAFAKCYVRIRDLLPSGYLGGLTNYYLTGHSYGGACAQAMGAILSSQGQTGIKMWSYGSPRPGNTVLQTRLQNMANTRIFGDNDPVRFIPPHSNEVPALTYLESAALIQGCNTQVQAPRGWQLEANGHMAQTEGASTDLHAVGYSVAGWCADLHGFRSVNHSPQTYLQRFVNAADFATPTPIAGLPPFKDAPLVATARTLREFWPEAIEELAADAVSPTGVGAAYQIPQIPIASTLRYKRKKVNKTWVVQWDGQTVAIGPGKRKAGSIARRFNRVATAMQIVEAGV